MLKRIATMGLYVKDQNEALRFYTEKLGFEVRADIMVGDYRWLTVGLKTQPDFEYALTALKPGGEMDEETVKMLTKLVEQGKMSAGILKTDDIYKTYEEFKAHGVEFSIPPTRESYGIQAIFNDNSGNWFTLVQE